jgi:serine/threonine protein phosphatase 1
LESKDNKALSRYIFGDVHGQFEALMLLVAKIKPQPDDQLFFLGDLIDRGDQSAQVVSWVKDNGYPCLRGNHEQMCLEAHAHVDSHNLWRGWLHNGGSNTLESYGTDQLPADHLAWMRSLPLYLDLGDAWLVHAGLDPRLDIEEQSATEFCWIREEFHSSTEPYFDDKLIITGHTITFVFPGVPAGHLALGKGWVDIDTGAYHPRSGWLTALNLDEALVYQANVYTGQTRLCPFKELAVPVEPMPVRSSRWH